MRSMPSRLLMDRNSTNGTMDSSGPDEHDYEARDDLDRDALGINSSISFSTIEASGPSSRPLEFPAPIVDRATTVSADILDHRTGNVFTASSVLMRQPIHAKTCASRPMPSSRTTNAPGSSFDSSRSHMKRSSSRDSIHSWHSAFNAPSSSLNADSPKKQSQHRRVQSHSPRAQQMHCSAGCDLPNKAYCVRKKLVNTTYGSIRLCVVLKRVSRNVMNYANRLRPGDRDMERVPSWETTDEMVAIKVVNWSKLQSLRGRHLEDPIKELAALQQLLGNYHPNVVSLLDALQNETHLFYVFPYIAGGDLYGCLLDKMVSSPTGLVEESQARVWFRQILCGISHLQKKGVCHRDLCLENMMVDEQNNIRIIDFGLCLRVPYADPNNRVLVADVSANTTRRLMKTQGQCGFWEYMAPETAMRSDTFDGFAIDLWAAGIILFEFLVGKKPFAMPDPVDQNFRTISIEGNLAGLLRMKGIEVNHKAVDLMQKMLCNDPSKRLTLSEIVNHPWVRGNGKKIIPSPEKDVMENKWFIKKKSIDEAKSINLALTGFLDPYARVSTVESMASTADISDAESQHPPLSHVSSYDDSLSNESSYQKKPSFESLEEPDIGGVQIDTLDSLGDAEDSITENKITTQKKQGWLNIRLKPTNWRRAAKSS